MSRTFRFLYWRVCCVMCTTRKKVISHHLHRRHHNHYHHHHHLITIITINTIAIITMTLIQMQRCDAVAEQASALLE